MVIYWILGLIFFILNNTSYPIGQKTQVDDLEVTYI